MRGVFRDGERLTALGVYARVPLRMVHGGVRLLVRLDVDGTGLHTVPKHGYFIETTWRPGDAPHDPGLASISEEEWRNILVNALPPTEPVVWDTGETDEGYPSDPGEAP